MKILPTILAAGAVLSLPAQKKMNVLFIAIDDLKPETSAHGNKYAITPNIQRLADHGALFTSCYVQQAISGPTRASILTGTRPDRTRVWDLLTDFRQVNPNAVSLPQYFKENGYQTQGMGKIFHVTSAGPGHDAPSWSIPHTKSIKPGYGGKYGARGPAVEAPDVADNELHDGYLAEMAVEALTKLSKNNEKPFFLAVGFLKPHLPFVAPKKYWDLYKREEAPLAPFQQKAKNSPDVAYHSASELKSYSDIPFFDSYSDEAYMHLNKEKQKELLHGYYAAMSYTDANIGKVVDQLYTLGLEKNTIIVLWGDHGWHLGDHGLWSKMTDFEQATHAFFMMSVPGMPKGIKPSTPCEFLDVFPTLCDLNGLAIPSWLDGVTLAPALKNPKAVVKEYAMSQYPRPKGVMGYTIRTQRFRYTQWIGKEFTTDKIYNPKEVVGVEMYDYANDPLETVSVIGDPKYKKEQEYMEKLFAQAIEREYGRAMAFNKIADYQPIVKVESAVKQRERKMEANKEAAKNPAKQIQKPN